MPAGIRPKVNEAREFLEIAKDFSDPREIIREAISNSWDAKATEVFFEFKLSPIPGTRAKQIDVRISDNGDGMEGDRISDFFDLGESHKPAGSIGTKGHGTKIYYKSQGIKLDTWFDGEKIHAETEIPPWPSLKEGKVPTYQWEPQGKDGGKGADIRIVGFDAKQKEFSDFQDLQKYILWSTVSGSFGHYFGQSRSIKVKLKTLDLVSPATIDFGFQFPAEDTNLEGGTSHICKIFPPRSISCGNGPDDPIQIDVVGAILGESHRGIVPDTYTHMGIWLSKDFIKIERVNDIIEEVTGGQYYYRQFLVLANSQQLDLTANRDAFTRSDEEFDIVYDALRGYFKEIWDDDFTKAYLAKNRDEDNKAEEARQANNAAMFKEELNKRVKAYDSKVDLKVTGVTNPPIKEPTNEAETILLLQAMISSKHPSIDFVIGEYSAYRGQDFIIEFEDRGVPQKGWGEVVFTLDKLFKWEHRVSLIHKIVCWKRSDVSSDAKLSKIRQGIYELVKGEKRVHVYVLSEILSS